MTHKEIKNLLCENLNMLSKNLQWLEESYLECKNYRLDNIDNLNKYQLINLEALAGRFGRTIDIYELENVENKLDILIRAEKRGFVDNYEILIEMKDLRNKVVHKYIIDIAIVFKLLIEYSPILIDIVKKIENYIKNEKGYCL